MGESIPTQNGMSRRDFIKIASASALSMSLGPLNSIFKSAFAEEKNQQISMRTRPIPSTGEELPVVGVGTWQQFDVSPSPELLEPLKNVLRNLFNVGGSVIDSSPMYGSAESIIGRLLDEMDSHEKAFVATKVWTRGRGSGIQQMNDSLRKFRTNTIDLMQIHNLVDWQTHMNTLRKWKENGKIRYHGVTHYTDSAFDELERVMKTESPDFVQLPYSIAFRKAENRLLPLASDREIAVIVNRPFKAGGLFRSINGASLPKWASDIDINSWAQYFLKYILGHPDVTCVIPGTSNPKHMLDNARAGVGALPSEDQRKRMVNYWESL